ncbi:unnamed protein product, partial [Rangifer tarandus platyrhynchus]
MMLGASCDGATSEVSKPEKDVEPDAEVCSEIPGGQVPGSKPRSGSGPEAEASPLDFIVATEREFEEVLAILAATTAGSRIPTTEQCRPNATNSNPHRQQWPRLQIARESVHGIDAGETAPPERPGARLLEHFCSQLVRQHPGDQSGPTQQGRSAGVPEAEEIPPNHQAEQRSSEGHPFGPIQLVGAARPQASSRSRPGRLVVTWHASCVALLAARREEPSQEWPPYWPSESNLRLLAAKGLEWRVDSRAPARCSRCARALPHPAPRQQHVVLPPRRRLQRRRCAEAEPASVASAAPEPISASTSCANSSRRPSCGQGWLTSTRLAGGSRWSRVVLNSSCWRPTT